MWKLKRTDYAQLTKMSRSEKLLQVNLCNTRDTFCSRISDLDIRSKYSFMWHFTSSVCHRNVNWLEIDFAFQVSLSSSFISPLLTICHDRHVPIKDIEFQKDSNHKATINFEALSKVFQRPEQMVSKEKTVTNKCLSLSTTKRIMIHWSKINDRSNYQPATPGPLWDEIIPRNKSFTKYQNV